MIRYTFGRGTIASALILPGFVIVDAFRNALPAVHRYRKDLSKKWRLDNPRPTMKLPHPDFLYDEFTKTQLGMNLETQEQTTAISQEAKIEPASLPNNEGEIDGLKRRLVQLQDDMDQAQRRATSSERRVNFLRKKLREMESVGATPPKENDSEVARQSTPYASDQEKKSLMDRLRDAVDELQRVRHDSQTKLMEQKAKAADQERQLQLDLNLARQQVATAEEDLEKAKIEIKEIAHSRDDMRNQLLSTIESAQNDIHALDRQMEEQESLRKEEAKAYDVLVETTRAEMAQRLKEAKVSAEQERKALNSHYNEKLRDEKERTEREKLEMRILHERTRETKNEVIGRYQSALAILEVHLRDTKSRANEERDTMRKELSTRLEDLARSTALENAKILEAHERALAARDETIDRLKNLNEVLSNSLRENTRFYKKEVENVRLDMTKTLIEEKSKADNEKKEILRENALLVTSKNSLIEFYQDERSSIRKLARQSWKVTKFRLGNVFRDRKRLHQK